MKILHVLNSAKFGGMEFHVRDLVEGLYNLGHDIFVWCPEGEMVKLYRKSGGEVTNKEIKFDIDPGYIFSLTKFLKENEIDVIHAHELKAVVNSMIAGVLAGTKVRISHTHTPISEWQIPSIKKFINTRFFNSPVVNFFSSKEIALTESRKRVKIKEGIKARKLVVIPNGIDIEKHTLSQSAKNVFRKEILDAYSIPHNNFIFGNLGRLSVEKGIPVLIEAFAKFLKNVKVDSSHVSLLVAGAGDLHGELKNKIEEFDLVGKVILTGDRFSDDEKLKFYSSFDVFVFPTLAEGFGLVLGETMAVGLPIICSDLDVLQEVGGSTVRFFETGNSSDLAQKMYNMYVKRDMLQSFSEDTKERVRELFNLQKFIASYENLYLNVLEGVI